MLSIYPIILSHVHHSIMQSRVAQESLDHTIYHAVMELLSTYPSLIKQYVQNRENILTTEIMI